MGVLTETRWPADDGEKGAGTAAAGEPATLTYAAPAASKWFLPAGVIVSAIAAGILG